MKLKNILGFGTGIFLANGFEWMAHNYLLHGRHQPGQKRKSLTPASMNSHWTHHKFVRQNNFRDTGYEEGLKNERNRHELMALGVLLAVITPLMWRVNRGFVASSWYAAWNYYVTHRRAHTSPEFGMQRMPWHYDHHMNSNQDANWCVTRPWFDYIMGTRVASSASLLESNPLGMSLPALVENPLNNTLRGLFPHVFTKVGQNLKHETENRQQGKDEPLPDIQYLTR